MYDSGTSAGGKLSAFLSVGVGRAGGNGKHGAEQNPAAAANRVAFFPTLDRREPGAIDNAARQPEANIHCLFHSISVRCLVPVLVLSSPSEHNLAALLRQEVHQSSPQSPVPLLARAVGPVRGSSLLRSFYPQALEPCQSLPLSSCVPRASPLLAAVLRNI